MNLKSKCLEFSKFKLGIQLKRHNFFNSEMQQLLKILNSNYIPLLLDVGANIGQFATEIRKEGFEGKIVSFEPLSQAHSLLQQAAKNDDNWIIAPRCAIGDTDGTIEINIAGNLASSSILDMMDKHLLASPGTKYIGKEIAPIIKIDTVLSTYLHDNQTCFIKIDTQGFEEHVINGSINSLSKIIGFYMELSLVELYNKELLMEDMLKKMKNLKYNLVGIWPSFIDPDSGHTYQVNAIFLKE